MNGRAPDESAANARTLRFVTWNIHGAVGTDGVRAPGRIARVLQTLDADVVALQEVPLGGQRGNDAENGDHADHADHA
ncbi:endonuclease/exonuclease/phosphatase family protein, partial [Paraburkholderia sp. J41]|uniref:endonuclease/exonuclease/phosphatase family protein n=1 Tax=Paraburkholderia sp. J41 TaxID=2805433 RepID=UPI0039F4B9B8